MKTTRLRNAVLDRKLISLAVASCFISELALANPTHPTVVSGAATFQQAGNLLKITNSPSAIINWQSFSIGASEITRFIQQSQASAVLNRVTGSAGVIDPSVILGALQSNGRVLLINPSGILFGAGAQIDVAGLVATSLNLSNTDFLAGRLKFTEMPGAGSIVNQGNVTTGTGGNVYLVGPAVTNSGIITSPKGEVILAAGNSVELVNPGTPNLRVEITAPDNEARNLGSIVADSGRIGIYAGLINHSGTIRADAAQVTDDGRIVLKATKSAILESGSVTSASGAKGGSVDVQADVLIHTGSIQADGAQGGSVAVQARNVLSAGRISADGSQGAGGEVNVQASGRILQTSGAHVSADGAAGGGKVALQATDRVFGSGTLTATGLGAGSAGGEIKVLGNEIVLLGASLDASGDAGGGTVLVGGDFQGRNPAIQNATTNQINFSTTINADARTTGDGGKVIVWSDQETQFYGTISARGGAASGDGGFIEVSGKESLIFGGMADAGAPNGTPGTLLLDPKFIVIDAAGGGSGLTSFLLIDPTVGTGDQFAQSVTVLGNDNIVATDPFNDLSATDAGAVYLFNGATGALVSTITGSNASDRIGSGGVTALTGNSNFVVRSSFWNGSRGAVSWGNGTTGFIGGGGAVSAANSLVGSTLNDFVGSGGVTALTNGNYVVSSPLWDNASVGNVGAVTFGNGTTGISGAVSASNSLVGTTASDQVGNGGATALSNGNYVVINSTWDNVTVVDAGAVTFGSGTTGISGAVSSSNSLVGTTLGDVVGSGGVTALSNGNYVVSSPGWDNVTVVNAGAVTFGSGTTGISGAVSSSNSLVGTTANDVVGLFGVTALTNGNYVVSSGFWDNATVVNAGAVTFGNGTTGISGAVSASNSLVGTTLGDAVGSGRVTALSNGNYVVSSPGWDNGGVVNAGAVTFGSGTTGVSGAVSVANSLVGTTMNDLVGNGGITALANGNYVVRSDSWNNSAATSAGAVTFGNGVTGTSGAVTIANSLHGTSVNDFVGSGGVVALSNGNYLVRSVDWNNGPATEAGALTFGSGTSGVAGAVSVANSLVGSNTVDLVGLGNFVELGNGTFVQASSSWNGNRGAVTVGSTTSALTGTVSATNSLLGVNAGDSLGSGGLFPLSNNNVVVSSPNADNSMVVDAGLVHVVVPPATASGQTFASNAAGSVTLTPSAITAITNTGTAVTLQANTDITLAAASDIITNNPSGNGGAILLQAGRSVLLNSNITTDNGALTLIANETTANGVVNANRDAGAAVITMAPGTTINAGSGNISMTVGTGATRTGTAAQSGDITLANLTTTGHVLVQNLGPTAGSGIVRADATQLITASSAALDANGAGGGGKIGTAATPIRVTVTNLEARAQSGGAFFSSPTQGLTVGGSAALGALTGIDTSSAGAVDVSAAGTLTVTENSFAAGAAAYSALGALSDIVFTSPGTLGGSSGSIAVTAGRDILYNSTQTLNNSSGGIALSAGNDVVFSTGSINNSSGAITVNAGRDFTFNGIFLNTSSGAMTLSAGRDIALSRNINSSSGAIAVSAGNNLTYSATGTLNNSSGSITLSAGNDILFSAGSINTSGGAITVSAGHNFAYNGGGNINTSSGSITSSANNDITLSRGINTSTGAIGLQAGRSVILNAGITTGSALPLPIVANDPAALSAKRDAGAGGITMAPGTTLNAGSGTATLTVGTGVSGAASGNLTIENISATNVNLQQNGRTSGSSILRASPTSLITATNLLMEVDFGGLASGGSIGMAAAPMRVTVTNLESHTHEASPGIFIDSPTQGLTIGGVPFFAGLVKGVQNVTSGDISITANGNLITQAPTALPAGCGPTGGTGGPICSTSGGNVSLTATGGIAINALLSAGGNLAVTAGGAITQGAPLTVTGTSTVNAGANAITLTNTGNDFQGVVTLSNSGATNAVSIVDANSISFAPLTLGGAFTVTAPTIVLSDVTNTGFQQYNGNVTFNSAYNTNNNAFTVTGATTVGSNSTITTGTGAVTLTGAVNSQSAENNSLTINSSGATVFGGTIGATQALSSITTDSAGTASLGGNVTTTGAQAFNDLAGGSNITLASTGGGAITATSSASTFPSTISTSGAVALTGTAFGSAATPLVLTATPLSLSFTQVVTAFATSPAVPPLTFLPASSITINGVIVSASTAQQPAASTPPPAVDQAVNQVVAATNQRIQTQQDAQPDGDKDKNKDKDTGKEKSGQDDKSLGGNLKLQCN